jgi:short-subunit dehydrogenase
MAGGDGGAWEYAGKWALVTGASSGIGEVLARALAARGMNVALAARREDLLQRLAEELRREYRVQADVLPADLGKPAAAGVLWIEATDGREIHLLVNNAGFGLKGRFDALPLGIMSAEEVVEATLRALEAGEHTVVPGALNRLGTLAGRMFPRSLVVRAAKTVMKRMR